ncbi:hypothetical protein GALMADRAFT_39882, partial [Galerina marginata CBS 339.88]
LTPHKTRQTRSYSLPPLSSDDLVRSSPIVGTASQRATLSRMKGQAKRTKTMEKNRLALLVEEETKQQEELMALQHAEDEKHSYFSSVLEGLRQRGYSFGQLVLYVSDPVFKQGIARWDGMLKDGSFISRIFNLWAFKASITTRNQVREWAVNYVAEAVREEAKEITSSRFLQTNWRPINSKPVLGFNVSKIQTYFQDHGSIFMRILKSLATSSKQVQTISPARVAKKAKVITASALGLLGEYSNSNNWAKKAIGLYLYSTGSQRQLLSVMSHLGISESYNTITGKNSKKEDPDGKTPLKGLKKGGSLRQLSDSMLDMARVVASKGLFATSYDNINMVFRAAEQIVGRTDAQENGTCATIWPLFKASILNMQLKDLEDSFNNALPLSILDILLTAQESKSLNENLVHCILRIIVTHGGESFKKFRADLERTCPSTEHKIDLHQTPLHPLPAFDIDESTIIGGAGVVDAVFDILEVKKTPGWSRIVRFFCGDQLTIARLRALVNIRAGHEGGYTGFGWGVWMPGFFHAKMADIHGVFMTHWGKPSAGPQNPGCLGFHNTVLQRKPILLTSLPPFRTCRDLIFVSLYARILHCLLLVSKQGSLEDYSKDITWEKLYDDARTIMLRYANADVVADLRWRRRQATALSPECLTLREGDMVFENAVLFLRDALISREFTDAVKSGDSGRVVLILKTWALSFRGIGRTKYAHEMLHLIHNITHVWPKAVRDIVFNNWLINTTGNPNSWVEVDLMQEHMNYWIKNFYRAHGSAASWAWLKMIAPCVHILRDLGRNFKQMLGTDLGTAHHPMDLSVDLPDLMQSLDDHEVYVVKNGRYLDDDDLPVPNIISSGLIDLLDGKKSPLNDYNTAFVRLQARRRLTPLFNGSELDDNEDMDDEDEDSLGSQGNASEDDDSEDGEDVDFHGEVDDDDIGDFLRSFEDTSDEGTLCLDSAADVSLDMDAEDLGLEEECDDSDEDVASE